MRRARNQPDAAQQALAAADAAWPKSLRTPGDFLASTEAGELWIESSDFLLQLRLEATVAIDTVLGARP